MERGWAQRRPGGVSLSFVCAISFTMVKGRGTGRHLAKKNPIFHLLPSTIVHLMFIIKQWILTIQNYSLLPSTQFLACLFHFDWQDKRGSEHVMYPAQSFALKQQSHRKDVPPGQRYDSQPAPLIANMHRGVPFSAVWQGCCNDWRILLLPALPAPQSFHNKDRKHIWLCGFVFHPPRGRCSLWAVDVTRIYH